MSRSAPAVGSLASRRPSPGRRRRPGPGRRSALLGLVLVAAGCGLSAPERNEARVVVDADDQESQVQIVTSTEFTVSTGGQGGPSVSLVASDTTVRTLPYDTTFDIVATRRFFVRAQTPAAATDTPSVVTTVRVIVDGEERNRVQGDLADEPVQAVFLSDE